MAEAVIDTPEAMRLSAFDHAHALDVLEHPRRPNARLRAAITALPDTP